MSNSKFLTAVSCVALMAAAPAFADTNDETTTNAQTQIEAEQRTSSQDDMPHMTEEDVKEGWNDAKQGAKEGWNNTKEAVKEGYQNVKATLVNEDSDDKILIKERVTASGILGKPVYNTDGERVAKVKDIILDDRGQATMVILADGDFTGLGKLAAFDYTVLTERTPEGDMIVALTEEMIDQAASFSYDTADARGDVKVIPQNGYSVAELLDAKLVGANGEELADIDNISFKNGSADRLIVGFNEIFNMGGDKAALDYEEATLVRDADKKVNFELSSSETRAFETYKRTVVN